MKPQTRNLLNKANPAIDVDILLINNATKELVL